MKSSRPDVHGKFHGLPQLRFEDQQLTSFSGLVIVQELFGRLDIKTRLRRCFRHLQVTPIFGHAKIVLLLIVHMVLGFRELRDIRYYVDDPLVKRVLGLKRLPDVATISRALSSADEESVRRLHRLLRELVLVRLTALCVGRVTLDFDAYTHKKQSGGSGQFAEVKMILTPTEPGEGYSFESRIVGGAVPKEYIPGVEKGIKSVMDSGPLAGFPVIDFKVALIDGKFHDVDSSVLAFEIAARMGMREGMKKAGAKLLEPIMKVEVISPEDYTGNVIGDLTSRRGQVTGQEPRGNAIAINAFVPLANMFGYINTLRSMSSGRAQFTMQFDHYDPVPQNISDEIQAKFA